MSIFKKKPYYFSDSSIAVDTVIALIMGGIALVVEIAGIVASIVTKGHTPAIFGTLYLCAIILAIVGELFAWFGNNAQEGGAFGKRVSIILNIVALVIPIWIVFLGK